MEQALLLTGFLHVPAYTFTLNSYRTNKGWYLSKKFAWLALVNKGIVLDTGNTAFPASGLKDFEFVLPCATWIYELRYALDQGYLWRGRTVPLLKHPRPRSRAGLRGGGGFQHKCSTRCTAQLSLQCIDSETKVLTMEKSKCP